MTLGVIEAGADLFFSLESLEEDGIGFHGAVGDFEGNLAGIANVSGAIDGSHAAFGNQGLDAIVVEDCAGFQFLKVAHGLPFLSDAPGEYRAVVSLAQTVGLTAIHGDALDIANANDDCGGVVGAVFLNGVGDEAFCNLLHLGLGSVAATDHLSDF